MLSKPETKILKKQGKQGHKKLKVSSPITLALISTDSALLISKIKIN
jgi:hypothetical protein